MIAAVFASIAGSFDAYYVHYISPESYTITFSIILVTGVIIGGLRHHLGRRCGGRWSSCMLPELLKRVNEDLTNLVFGVLLIAIMISVAGAHARACGRACRRVARQARRGGRTRPPELGE